MEAMIERVVRYDSISGPKYNDTPEVSDVLARCEH